MHRKFAILPTLLSMMMACGTDHGATDAGHGAADADHGATDVADGSPAADAPSPGQDATADVPAATDAPADGGAQVPLLNDCRAADYEDRSADAAGRTVVPRGNTGYTPRCMIIRAGQSVTFEMNFATHPLVAGIPHGPTAGATSPNPIMGQTSGMTYTATFASGGYFPFYCNTHRHVGMAGVVRVMP